MPNIFAFDNLLKYELDVFIVVHFTRACLVVYPQDHNLKSQFTVETVSWREREKRSAKTCPEAVCFKC